VDAAFAQGLFMRVDSQLEDHGMVEPDTEMLLDEYRQALAATQLGWVIEAWDEGIGV
jgi:hypothetical protein